MKLVPVLILVATIALLSMAATARAEDEKLEEIGTREATMTQKDLPAAVLTAFQKSYPKAEISGVSEETDSTTTLFEIESVEGTAKRTIIFTADGKLSAVEEVIATKDLPQAAQQGLATKYPKAEIMMAERVTTEGIVTYEALIATGNDVTEIVFDHTGNTISTETVSSEENEEGEDEDD
jgi:hypothetical protein